MRSLDVGSLDFEKGGGLVPVVVQEAATKRVLMVAYATEEAVRETLRTGYAHYWSRSRGTLWRKGATSGHTQRVKRILVDCDQDALVYVVVQKGYACHEMKKSCFFRRVPRSVGEASMVRSLPER